MAAGWFAAGDLNVYGAAPLGTALWCDAFVMRRFPVTHGAAAYRYGADPRLRMPSLGLRLARRW